MRSCPKLSSPTGAEHLSIAWTNLLHIQHLHASVSSSPFAHTGHEFVALEVVTISVSSLLIFCDFSEESGYCLTENDRSLRIATKQLKFEVKTILELFHRKTQRSVVFSWSKIQVKSSSISILSLYSYIESVYWS